MSLFFYFAILNKMIYLYSCALSVPTLLFLASSSSSSPVDCVVLLLSYLLQISLPSFPHASHKWMVISIVYGSIFSDIRPVFLSLVLFVLFLRHVYDGCIFQIAEEGGMKPIDRSADVRLLFVFLSGLVSCTVFGGRRSVPPFVQLVGLLVVAAYVLWTW